MDLHLRCSHSISFEIGLSQMMNNFRKERWSTPHFTLLSDWSWSMLLLLVAVAVVTNYHWPACGLMKQRILVKHFLYKINENKHFSFSVFNFYAIWGISKRYEGFRKSGTRSSHPPMIKWEHRLSTMNSKKDNCKIVFWNFFFFVVWELQW